MNEYKTERQKERRSFVQYGGCKAISLFYGIYYMFRWLIDLTRASAPRTICIYAAWTQLNLLLSVMKLWNRCGEIHTYTEITRTIVDCAIVLVCTYGLHTRTCVLFSFNLETKRMFRISRMCMCVCVCVCVGHFENGSKFRRSIFIQYSLYSDFF